MSSVNLPLMAIKQFDHSNRGLSALFKVTWIVAFEERRGLSFPSDSVFLKPTTVLPFSVISSFIFIIFCSASIGCLLFMLAVHMWENLLFILVHLSHLSQLHSRILKQHVGRQSSHMCGLFSLLLLVGSSKLLKSVIFYI